MPVHTPRGPEHVARPLRGRHNAAHDESKDTLVAHALSAEGFDASEDGTGRGTPIIPFQQHGSNVGNVGTLPAGNGNESGGVPCVAFSCKDHGADADRSTAPTLRAMGHDGSHANAGGQVAVAAEMSVRRLTPRECERLQGFPDDYTLVPGRGYPREDYDDMVAYFLRTHCYDEAQAREAAKHPDGPRYKALGNAMAVNVMRWIGQRIELCDKILQGAVA